MRARAVRLDNEERLGAAVVRAVEDGTGGETEGHPVFLARGTDDCRSYPNGQSITLDRNFEGFY